MGYCRKTLALTHEVPEGESMVSRENRGAHCGIRPKKKEATLRRHLMIRHVYSRYKPIHSMVRSNCTSLARGHPRDNAQQ